MEIMEEQGLGNSRRLSNGAHGRLLIGVLAEDPEAGLDNGLLLGLGQGIKLRIHCFLGSFH